jgi:DNA (cytosine-5)-methyltransferase 1
VNEDIATVDAKDIPDHTLLVGGFPCQDYSVARTLSKEKGIQGKKGVLWWEIHRILDVKRPPFILLENVDRLLKSPSKQRGRDFGVMLKSLSDMGYGVEWRVINAADYGAAQRRRRVFIFGFHKNTSYYKTFESHEKQIYVDGLFARTFPVENKPYKERDASTSFKSTQDLVNISDTFKFTFYNTGVMMDGNIRSIETVPVRELPRTLGSILEKDVDDRFYLTQKQIKKHEELKGSKRIPRVKPNGETYYYSEGNMSFPDDPANPGRTMLTSEGTINRSSHVVKDPATKRLRKITPIEAERLNHFPDGWTNTGLTDRQRYFMMGNALVVEIIRRLSLEIKEIVQL